jgi:hypothetical protein
MSQELKIQHLNGEILTGEVNYYRVDDYSCKWNLVFISPVTKKFETINSDLFECLIDLRQELARHSYRPLCNGARKDVYPSRMCRDMAGGYTAYIVRVGQSANLEDLVNIFDYAKPSLIATVEEQLSFYESWIYPNGKDTPLQKELQIKDKNDYITIGKLFVYEYPNPPRIIFESSLTPNFECTGGQFFECLLNLREKLAENGFIPLCNGARVDNYIFISQVEMFGGRNSHTLVLNKIPSEKDEMYVFEYADPSLVVSIDEQRYFYELWLESIKSIPISDYKEYGIRRFQELYFRLIQIGDLMKMWAFDIDIDDDDETARELNLNQALSPLSPEEVNRIGELRGEAIVGFFSDYTFQSDTFIPNKLFISFMQRVISIKAPQDHMLQSAAIEKQEGWICIIDDRASELEEPLPEDIIGTFEVKAGSLIIDSYCPNENYAIFGERGLFQLPPFLSKALIEELKASYNIDSK